MKTAAWSCYNESAWELQVIKVRQKLETNNYGLHQFSPQISSKTKERMQIKYQLLCGLLNVCGAKRLWETIKKGKKPGGLKGMS